MHLLDWSIVAALFAGTTAAAIYTRRYNRSVADFLAANRAAGRYMLAITSGIAGLCAITIISFFEMYYAAGFVPTWWYLVFAPVGAIIASTGWVRYRFRETRALTLAQYFEIRYSRRFRFFAGALCWISGIANFGIYPAVAANFFIHYCGLPATFAVFGLTVSTFVAIMLFLLSIALFFTFLGGQITIMTTDFIQGVFFNIAVVVVLVVVFNKIFSWPQISQALAQAPENASLINPIKTSNVKDFNVWFFLISLLSMVLNHMGWQGSQAYQASAINPHEARMAQVLTLWRALVLNLLIMLLPICAYTFMHHSDFASQAESARETLNSIADEQLQEQVTVSVALAHILPVGLLGTFCALMLAAFITSSNTMLHSWGSIFIQDVLMPIRSTPYTPRQHFRHLRWSIAFVAVFVFLFSLLFKQNEYISFYLAITSAIFLGGSGPAIIGGLYWKRGTTAGAWASMITGSGIAVSSIIIRQIDQDFIPINSQWVFGITMVASICAYIIVSLLTGGETFNMDRMLHRGRYALRKNNNTATGIKVNRFSAMVGITNEFSWRDKWVVWSSIVWTFGWLIVFIVGTVYGLLVDTKNESWIEFWKYFVMLNLVFGGAATVWFVIGGFGDMKRMFDILRTVRRNDLDDGRVTDHHNLADEQPLP